MLAHGAEIDTDAEGDTPADYAREFGFEEIAALFAEMKRNPVAARERLRDEMIPGHAEGKAEKAAAERAKLEVAEKKRTDAEKERRRTEREAREKKELTAVQQKRRSARIGMGKPKKV